MKGHGPSGISKPFCLCQIEASDDIGSLHPHVFYKDYQIDFWIHCFLKILPEYLSAAPAVELPQQNLIFHSQ